MIREALAGEARCTCGAWRRSRARRWPERDALRAALRGDCHTHSDWSDGGSPIGEMAVAARDLGHEYLVLTDHSPRLTVANGLTADRLRAQLDEVALLNEELAPFRILTGIEVDILEDGALDQERRPAGPARRGGGQRALQAADAAGGDDRADARRGRQPAHQRARALHRPDGDRDAGAPGVRVRPGRGVRGLRRARRRGGDQLPAGAARPARSGCSGWRSRPAACSRSTPTRTRRASSTGCATAASGPVACGVPPGRVVNTRNADEMAGSK